MIRCTPVEDAFNALGSGISDVIGHGKTVDRGQSVLDVFPSFEENIAVDDESVIEPTRLPAQLIIGQRVRQVLAGRYCLAQTLQSRIATPGSETGRIGEVQKMLRIDLPAEASFV